jgi:hypothetical protein
MKTIFLVIFTLCFFLLGTSAAILFYTQYVIYDTKEIPMDVRVSDHIGFNLATDKLHFGRTTTPGSGEHAITVRNQYTRPLIVTIETYGEIGSWVYPKEYNQTFKPNESRDITLEVNVPSNISYGDHNGTIRVLFLRELI